MTPDGTRAYVANAGSNSVSVINLAAQAVVATVPVGFLPVDEAITATNVYVANAGGNTVSVIRTSNNSVTATVRVGSNPVNIGTQ
jgi:YVTN family beta-propeller protein